MILSARYANPDHTALIASTDDAGDVAISERDTPDEFAAVVAAVEVAEYAPPAEPVPEIISDRQFYQGLALKGTITQSEALYAVKMGTIPSKLQSFLSNLTGDAAFNAEMLLSGAVEFHRSHPLTAQIGALNNWTDAQIDDFWRFCKGL